MVIEHHVNMQFWSEIVLAIPIQTLAARSSDFENMHVISDQIAQNKV